MHQNQELRRRKGQKKASPRVAERRDRKRTLLSAVNSHCRNHIHWITLYDKRVAFRVFQAFNLEVNVQSWPLYGIASTHAYVQYVTDTGITHPRNSVVGQEIILTTDAKHNAIAINHQYACRCVGGIAL